jgi:hypothetical protein
MIIKSSYLSIFIVLLIIVLFFKLILKIYNSLRISYWPNIIIFQWYLEIKENSIGESGK